MDRNRRRDAALARLSESQKNCAATETRLASYREILQSLRDDPPTTVDPLLDELDMRLPTPNCFAYEATLNWWFDRKLADRKAQMLRLLTAAKATHAPLLAGKAESLDRLIYLLKNVSSKQLEDLLAEMEKRYSAALSTGGDLEELLKWWRESERKQRIADLTETFAAMIKAVPEGDPLREAWRRCMAP